MDTNYKFYGWVGGDATAIDGKLEWQEFQPKTWEEADVDIQITHSAICGSDLHTLRNGWGRTRYPCVVGHEIVGKVIRLGSQVSHLAMGDMVGVGCQADSCQSRDGPCDSCENGEENYCSARVNTYDSVHRNGDPTYGGYAAYHRCPAYFAIKIPANIRPEHAAPMLCGGVTVFSPLRRYGVGPGKSVGVVGIGGLGHFAILFAKALGASSVVAISRRSDKKLDATKLGADKFIAVSEDEGWELEHKKTLDVIINTVSTSKMPLAEYLGLLRVGGTFVQLGAPEEPITLNAFSLIRTRVHLAGSIIGSPKEIREMFALASEKKIVPWVESRSMKDANQAMVDMVKGLARYRYVLTNEI